MTPRMDLMPPEKLMKELAVKLESERVVRALFLTELEQRFLCFEEFWALVVGNSFGKASDRLLVGLYPACVSSSFDVAEQSSCPY